MTTLIEAIARIEGFYIAGSRSQRNNNPGDLNFELYMAESYGATLETVPSGHTFTPRFAHFPNAGIGWAALHDLLSGPHYADLTIEAAINKYAPPVENQTQNYVQFVCRAVGCQPTDIVKEVLG